MEVITDTGPLLWLERIGYGKEFHKIYSTIWTPPAVSEELKQSWKDTAEIWQGVHHYIFNNEEEQERFNKLVRRWMRKHKFPGCERADVEVFILHRYFAGSNYAIYANEDAELKFDEPDYRKE